MYIERLDTESPNLNQISQLLGISSTQASTYVRANGLPYKTETNKKSGKSHRVYSWPDVLAWYVARHTTQPDRDLDELDRAKLLKLQSEAEREKLKLDAEKGHLLPADQIESALARTFGAANVQIQNFGDTLSKLLHDGQTPDERAELIQRHIDDIFLTLSTPEFLTAALPEDEEEDVQ